MTSKEKPMGLNVRPHDGFRPQTFGQFGSRYQADVSIGPSDTALGDAFARMRVSAPFTIFDSKLTLDNSPLFWDDAVLSGAGTSSTYNANQASVTLGVSNLTAGRRARQTKRRFNYQPGKSSLIVMTGVLGAVATGISRRVGYFDDSNGIFLSLIGSVLSVNRRSFVTGVVVDESVAQANWNLDKMDGSGFSGVTLDTSKTQIFFVDIEWLGVGRVRCGFYIDGIPIYVHQFTHANKIATVYMSTPNLPIRYEISNDGTGPAATLTQICSTVIVEGGQDDTGVTRAFHMGNQVLTLATAGAIPAVLAIRQKTTHQGVTVKLLGHSILCSTVNDKFAWAWILNPTSAVALTFIDQANSAMQVAIGTSTALLTGGTIVSAGYGISDDPQRNQLQTHDLLGSTIARVSDVLYLAVIPFASLQVSAAVQWRELV